MTENTDNLRKFIGNEDSAMRLMGLSMAKGEEIPDDILDEILWMYLMDEDKTIRATAKSLFMKKAPEEAKQAVKGNWKASHRDQEFSMIPNLESALNQTSVSLVEPLIKLIGRKGNSAVIALGKIGDIRAVEPLIKALDSDKTVTVEALGMIGDKRAVEPLMKLLENNDDICMKAAKALGNIGDVCATDALVKALKDRNNWWKTLGNRDYKTSSKEAMDFEDRYGTRFEGSAVYPVAEVSPNKRAKCKESRRKIQKGELRVAVEMFSSYGIGIGYILAEHFSDIASYGYFEVPDIEYYDGGSDTEFFLDTYDSDSEDDSYGNTLKVLMANSSSLSGDKFDELNEIIGGTIGARHHIIRALEKLGHVE